MKRWLVLVGLAINLVYLIELSRFLFYIIFVNLNIFWKTLVTYVIPNFFFFLKISDSIQTKVQNNYVSNMGKSSSVTKHNNLLNWYGENHLQPKQWLNPWSRNHNYMYSDKVQIRHATVETVNPYWKPIAKKK